jgi:hypothetical protein
MNEEPTVQQQEVLDAMSYIYEQKREALTTLVPKPDEIAKRIELIALLRGRRPDLYRLFLAGVEQEGWIALSEGKMPQLKAMDATRFIQTNSTSLDGKRSNQIVEIAQTGQPNDGRSILDWLTRGRGKK